MIKTNEIVNHLVRYFSDGQPELEAEAMSPQVEELVNQLGNFVGKRMQDHPPFKEVWEGFVDNPGVYTTFLVIALESLFNKEPDVYHRVNHLLEKITDAKVITAEKGLLVKKIDIEVQDEDKRLIPEDDSFPIVLIGNGQDGNSQQKDDKSIEDNQIVLGPSSLMVQKSSEIIYSPARETKLPFMFMSLGNLLDTSENLSLEDRQAIETHLDNIRFLVTEVKNS